MNLALLLAAFKATGAKVEERNAGGLPYYKIWGPKTRVGSLQTWLIVEGYNCTVSVAEPLATAAGAHPRPRRPIRQHELGYSAGPNYGRFQWALSARELMQRWPAKSNAAGAAERAVAERLAALAAATPGVGW
jgi:hypothetical protein